MEQECAHPALATVLLTLALVGCQKTDEIPAPKMPGSEAPAPEVQASEPANTPQTPPFGEDAPTGAAPGEGTPPSQ